MSDSNIKNLLTADSPLLAAGDRAATRLQRLGVRFMITASQTGGAFSVVEHPLEPLSLAAPYHTHSREDEYSIVLEGEVGFALDDKVIVGRPGDTIFKPRAVRHTFWNATNQPARILEIITPGGFEDYFAEVGAVFAKPGPPDVAALAAIATSYGLVLERETIPTLIARHGLTRSVSPRLGVSLVLSSGPSVQARVPGVIRAYGHHNTGSPVSSTQRSPMNEP